MEIKRLEQWSVAAASDDPYMAPERRGIALHGRVYGHGRFPDGSEITTSRVTKVEGRLITTYSGNQYELGDIDQGYLQWMHEKGFSYNYDNPIKTSK